MLLDDLLSSHLQIRCVPGLDVLLATSPYRDYLIACKVGDKAEGTLHAYARALSEFVRFLKSQGKELTITGISKNDVRLYFLYLMQPERHFAPSSRHQHYRSLKTFFNWLVKEEILKQSPMQNIGPPIVPRRLIRPFADGDIDHFLALTSGRSFLSLRNRAMILTFMECGVRLAEMAGMKLGDLDLDHATVRVFGKGRKERISPIGMRTQRAILEYLLTRHDGLPNVWLTEERTPLSPDGIQSLIARLCRQAGIQGMRHGPHTFRHTAAHHCRENGMSIEEIQTLLGHASAETTRHYLGCFDATKQMVAAHRRASPVDNFLKSRRI